MIRILPEDSLRRYITKHTPDADRAMVDQMVAYFQRQAENDPYLLLQPQQVSKAGAQHQIYKGMNLESALYLASLTGSIIESRRRRCFGSGQRRWRSPRPTRSVTPIKARRQP